MKKLSALISLAVLSACSTAPIPEADYEVFVLKAKENKLNAREPENDLPLSVCDDSTESAANCYVYRRDEYLKLQKDLVELFGRVQACEQAPLPASLQ